MRRAVIGEVLGPVNTLIGKPIELQVPKPGIVRATMLTMRPTNIVASSNPKAEAVEVVPTILFEVDPDEKPTLRTFAIVPAGNIIDSKNHLEFRGHFLYPDGNIFFLFEELDVPEDIYKILKARI